MTYAAAMKIGMVLAPALVALALAGCSAPAQPPARPATVTVTQPAMATAVQPSTAAAEAPELAAPATITIPEVEGQNAEIVRKNLGRLGLTDVNLASANPKYSNVILAKNWTVVSIEPPPGTVVAANDTVVVKVYKD